MNERVIQTVAFDPDGGVQISTYDPDVDVTQSGIVMMHTMLVPRGGQYDDELDTITEALIALIKDVYEDFAVLPKLGDPE